jgi:hypothetical protein
MRFARLIPRRSFLTRLAVWGAAGALFPPLHEGRTVCAAGPGAAFDRTRALLFQQHIGSRFKIVPAVAPPRFVVLANVTLFQTISKPGRGSRQPTPAFSLMFHAPAGLALPQETYRVEHPRLGAFPLFLVPIGPKQQNDVHYQAVFA